jgi:hypothetical protein
MHFGFLFVLFTFRGFHSSHFLSDIQEMPDKIISSIQIIAGWDIQKSYIPILSVQVSVPEHLLQAAEYLISKW